MPTAPCGHFQIPIADPGPCLACERAETAKGPLVSYAGGRKVWNNGPTVGESMRENRALWEADGLVGDKSPVPVDRNRWV